MVKNCSNVKMEVVSFLLIICIGFQPVLCSYLGYPRIYFKGKFYARANYGNNDACNYCKNTRYKQTFGSNSFTIENTTVISVLNNEGKSVKDDPIIGQSVFDSKRARISDLDVDCQLHSMLYGMKLGIELRRGVEAFSSDWTPNIIVQYYLSSGSQFMTTLTNIKWTNVGDSIVLQQLEEAVGDGNLVLKINLQSYGNEEGVIKGFIGVPSASDTLNVPGAREMLANEKNINTAPFEFYDLEVRIDLSNSFPRNYDKPIPIPENLKLGYLDGSCVQLIGDEYLHYKTEENGGIYVVAVDSDEIAAKVKTSQLVVVKVYDGDEGDTHICSESIFSIKMRHTVDISLKELVLFVRPTGVYIDRLDRIAKPSAGLKYYVTEFGFPSPNTIVTLAAFNHLERTGPKQDVLPIDGVIVTDPTKTTDRNGFVIFKYKLNPKVKIPNNRNYEEKSCPCSCANPPCTLPIDGQVYYFSMCAKKVAGDICQDPELTSVMLAFSDYNYTSPPTWVDNVGPILTLYDKVTPYMHALMDLSDYDVVSNNTRKIQYYLTREFDDPILMPTTRDLSPIKVQMILEWLKNPLKGFYEYNNVKTVGLKRN